MQVILCFLVEDYYEEGGFLSSEVAVFNVMASLYDTLIKLAESYDLRDVIMPILLLDIADHLAPPCFAEVDIKIGHRNALRIEEAFKQQAQLDRIQIGDGQCPCDQ